MQYTIIFTLPSSFSDLLTKIKERIFHLLAKCTARDVI